VVIEILIIIKVRREEVANFFLNYKKKIGTKTDE